MDLTHSLLFWMPDYGWAKHLTASSTVLLTSDPAFLTRMPVATTC